MLDNALIDIDDLFPVRGHVTDAVSPTEPVASRTKHASAMRPSKPTGLVVGPRLAAELERAFAARRCSGA